MIQEFIQAASRKLGTSEKSTGTLTGGLLGLIKEHASGADASALFDQVPGAEALARETETSGEGAGGGMLGGALGSAAGLLGGKAGSALDLAGLLEKSGLSMDEGSKLETMLVGFLEEKAGPDLVNRILGQVPALAKLAR